MKLVNLLFEAVDEEWKFITPTGNVLPHHVTLTKMKPYAGNQEDLGKLFPVKALGLAIDSITLNVAGINVIIPNKVSTQVDNPLHITVAIRGDGKPVNAGRLVFSGEQDYQPLSLELEALLANVSPEEMKLAAENIQNPRKTNGVAQLVLTAKSANLLKMAVMPLLANHQEQLMLSEEETPMEQVDSKKKIFVLVGPPSTGKSRWIKNTFEMPPAIISRDDLVEQVASEYGWTYDDLMTNPPPGTPLGEVDPKFGTVMVAPREMSWTKLVYDKVLAANKDVQSRFGRRCNQAPTESDNIVIDMTNMNASARKNNLRMIRNLQNFEKIAVVFEFQGIEDSILKVAEKRAAKAKAEGKSKTIPAAVLQSMFARFSRPTPNEGFDKIISVDKRELLRKLANGEPVDDNMEKAANLGKDVLKEEYFDLSRWKKLSGILKD